MSALQKKLHLSLVVEVASDSLESTTVRALEGLPNAIRSKYHQHPPILSYFAVRWLCPFEAKELSVGAKAQIVLEDIDEPAVEALVLNIDSLKNLTSRDAKVVGLQALC